MAGKDTDEIVVGANGTVRAAPVGTAAPADESAAPGVAWLDLGYTTEEGIGLVDSKTLEAIPVWQLFHPARRVMTSRDTTINFGLRQWGKDQVPFAFGGGTVSTLAPGHHKYAPPAPENIDERSLMVDWQDGTKKYRLVVVRGIVTENIDTRFRRGAAADLPIGFAVNGADGVDPWYLLTNDPAFA